MKSELSKLKKELWELCKQLTRKKYGNNCFTCGTYVEFPHTGHFFPSSICSTELKYDLANLRPQCYPCNVHKSGNWPAFYERLKNENGQKYINDLTRKNKLTKGKQYDILWYRAKVEEYRALDL